MWNYYMIPYVLNVPVIYCCVTRHPKTYWVVWTSYCHAHGLCIRFLGRAYQGWFVSALPCMELLLERLINWDDSITWDWCHLVVSLPTCVAVDADFSTYTWPGPLHSLVVGFQERASQKTERKLPVSQAWACKLAEHNFCSILLLCSHGAQSPEEGHRPSPLDGEVSNNLRALLLKSPQMYPSLSYIIFIISCYPLWRRILR